MTVCSDILKQFQLREVLVFSTCDLKGPMATPRCYTQHPRGYTGVALIH